MENTDSGQTGAKNAHWNATFDKTLNGHSGTEGGSSGSPLFNQDGLIIGTLSGGNSTCEDLEGSSLYGKLAYHWNKYGTEDSSRMDIWLDPTHTGATRLAGMTDEGKTISILKSPDGLTAKKISEGTLLEWGAPIYTQDIAWGTQATVYQFGFGGDPFYYGQRWEPTDLKPIHKKTITDVLFIPAESASYAIYIKQGDREYRQDVIDPIPVKSNRITLREPFVIDSDQELIVATHIKEYDKSVYPAFANGGPATYGKGNIYSMDGKTWEMLAKDELDADFILSVVVSSEEGELPTNLRSASYIPLKLSESPSRKFSVLRSEVTTSNEGDSIQAFPEITGYNVYRDQAKLADLPSNANAIYR